MRKEYKNWIDIYNKSHNIVSGFCLSASSLMIKDFPELILCRGYTTDLYYNKRTHWWCKTIDGEIIDPTVSQFFKDGIEFDLKYEEYDEDLHGRLATGKCMDCGNYLYDDEQFCNDECEKATMDYLKTNRMEI